MTTKEYRTSNVFGTIVWTPDEATQEVLSETPSFAESLVELSIEGVLTQVGLAISGTLIHGPRSIGLLEKLSQQLNDFAVSLVDVDGTFGLLLGLLGLLGPIDESGASLLAAVPDCGNTDCTIHGAGGLLNPDSARWVPDDESGDRDEVDGTLLDRITELVESD